MHEVVLHEHLEQNLRTKLRNHFVEWMAVCFIVSHRYSFHEALNQN